ncbi:MAG: T9SS type A sorting domain-containing protein [Ignavibacteriaceae bacterium]|nr:T9SS type A sorting domain-containing protein [Ignavibacteriaceae bacterium]
MKQFIHVFIFLSFLCLLFSENLFAQELPGIITNTVQYKGNNSADPNDDSGLPVIRERTAAENQLINEIRQLRETNDRSNLNRILELENQLESLNPNSVSKPGEYYDGVIMPAPNSEPVYAPEAIGNVEIRNTGTAFVSSMATATEQIGATAGRIWVAFSMQRGGVADTVRVYYSDTNGESWTSYAVGKLGGTDQIGWDEMDMEIIEASTGEKYIWIVYGFRNDAGTGRWRTGGLIMQSPTFGGSFYALSWPGDDATKRFYRLRITSDNAIWPSIAYVYMVASFDSSTGGSSHFNSQKTLRCTNPYTTTPTFQYKADKFWWNTTTNYTVDLHSDIAFFRNGSDSIIVSYSNIPDTTKIFFAKSDISNGPGTSVGAGGFIGGNNPSDHKQFARLSSNGNDNGSVYCVFRQNTNSRWWITYYRTTNFGNFNSMNQAVLQGSATSHSWQPEIVGVRNQNKHYFAWRLDGSPDSLRYIGTNRNGNWAQNIGIMNSQAILSGLQGPKPGFRYATDDSCFVIYAPTGPYDIWAAYGCSGPVSVEDNDLPPVNYSLSQNYPNPFNPSTTIKYSIPSTSLVKIKIFNTLGQEIAELVNQVHQIGNYEVTFNASSLPSGVYFYRLEADNFVQTNKMILIK